MTKLVSLAESLIDEKEKVHSLISKGLAPVVCYEPWFPRCLESIKQCLHDGFPVLMRLHSAASYPISLEERYQLDLESHAVLIVGYDDEKQALALIDPWDKKWGGVLHGRWWLSYPNIPTRCVDSSLGLAVCLTPLQTKLRPQWDISHNLSLEAQVGFYVPRGTVMDRTSWAITELGISCSLPDSWKQAPIDYTVKGHWIVGDIINVSLPLVSNPNYEGELKVQIKAQIEGKRPYEFKDYIEVFETMWINSSQLPVIQENYSAYSM